MYSKSKNTNKEMPYERHVNVDNNDDFGYPCAKKPKLSVTTVPSSSVLYQKNDDLWGEDLADDDMEECFQLASQMCSQHRASQEYQASASSQGTRTMKQSQPGGVVLAVNPPNLQSVTTVQVSQKLAPSDIFKVPCGDNLIKDVPTGKFRPKQWTNISNKLGPTNGTSVARSTNLSQLHFAADTARHNQSPLKSIPPAHTAALASMQEQIKHRELVEKLQNENAKLREKFFTKYGEISILRQQLRQSDVKASSQLQIKVQEYEAKFRVMEKELEKAKTTAELQKLEAWKAKDKLIMINASQIVPNVSTVLNESAHSEEFEGFSKVSPVISYGELLLDVVTPHLFIKSYAEINVVEPKTMFSLLDDTADRKRTAFYPTHYRPTVETCWESTMQLGLEETFDTVTAHCHIKKIFCECRKIMCCLLITLRERAEKETDYELDSRDRQNARVKVDALDNPNLLSHEMWYKIERGVESRRALGLVTEISMLSKYMADLVNGTYPKKKQSIMPPNLKETKHPEVNSNSHATCNQSGSSQGLVGHPPNCSTVHQCHILETSHKALTINGGPSSIHPLLYNHDSRSSNQASSSTVVQKPHNAKNSEVQVLVEENQCSNEVSCITAEVNEKKCSILEEVECFYKTQDFGFLKLIRDISQTIASQNNSFEYSGYLTAVIQLLTNIQYKGSPIEDTNGLLSIVCAIVETLIYSRPRMETTVAIAELVDKLVFNTEFMNALCHSSREKPNYEVGDCLGQCSQYQDSCALSVLCWLLERETNSSPTRTRICQAVVDWMIVGVKCRPFNGPKWTQCQKPSQADKCLCRTRMVETLVILTYGTFKDFEVLANTSKKESVRNVLVRGIMLLYYQIESDPDFGYHMEDVEGYYQLLLMGLKNTEHRRLNEHEDSALGELLAMEETITPPKFELTTSLEQHMDSITTKMELGWSEV